MAKQTVLITGASTGIGRASALRLDAAGWGVYAGVRSMAAGDELAAAASPRLQPVQLDVTVPEQIAELSSRLERELGSSGLGALVNNAGIPMGGPLDYVDVDLIRQCFEVNTFAPIAMVQGFRDQLRAANGRVVMMSSISARISAANMGPYSASKAGDEEDWRRILNRNSPNHVETLSRKANNQPRQRSSAGSEYQKRSFLLHHRLESDSD